MAPIIATDSCYRQQLIRVANIDNLQPMVANTKADFALRLAEACDTANPPVIRGRGRRAELRARVQEQGLKLSGESVRKWLSGESIPAMNSIRYISKTLSVHADWLLTGRGEKKPGKTPTPPDAKVEEQLTPPYFPEKASAISAAFSREEQDILDGYRKSNTRDREMMMFLAQRALEDFDKRSEQNK